MRTFRDEFYRSANLLLYQNSFHSYQNIVDFVNFKVVAIENIWDISVNLAKLSIDQSHFTKYSIDETNLTKLSIDQSHLTKLFLDQPNHTDLPLDQSNASILNFLQLLWQLLRSLVELIISLSWFYSPSLLLD